MSINTNDQAQKRILIIGGGFGGVKAALELAGEREFAVTLVSDQAEFRFYPALFRTATGGSRAASAIPLAEIFKSKPITIEHHKAETLDRDKKTVKLDSGTELAYDVLILALGSVTNYFGIKGLEEYSYGIKSLDEAEELKHHLHEQLLSDQHPDLNYVVVGGGPTGIELAGELPHYVRRIMERHKLLPKPIHVDLIEAAPRLLPRLPEDISRAVERRLTRIGVKLYLGEAIEAETADAIMIHGQPLQSHTVIWTAGMANHPFCKASGLPLSPKGRVVVNEYLQAAPDIYVLGDNAETLYTGMAQTALYDADFVAANLKRAARGHSVVIYRPKKPIYVMPAGPRWAAVLWGNLRIYGWLGWLLRKAADWVAYHDLTPWWKASKLWLAESANEEDCPTCMGE